MSTTAERIAKSLRRMSADELATLLAEIPALTDAAEGLGPLAAGWPWSPRRLRAPDLDELARTLASHQGIDFTVAGLDLFALQLAQLAVWHGGRLRREQALTDTQGAHGLALDRAARRLQRRFLAEPGQGWLTLRREAMAVLGSPGVTARTVFELHHSDDLATMLRNLGVSLVPSRKAERLDALEEALRDPEVIRRVVGVMPYDARRVLGLLLEHGAQRLTDLGIPYLAPWSYPPREPTPVDWLRDHGLVLVDFQEQRCTVVHDVILALQGGRLFGSWEPDPPDVDRRPLAATTPRVPPAVEHLTALLELWAAEPADALADGGLGVRPVRAAAKRLGLGAGHVGLLAHLAIRLELLGTSVVATKGRGRNRTTIQRWTATALVDAWRAEPADRRWARLVQAWRADPHRDDGDGLPERSEAPGPATVRAAPVVAREVLLALLARLADGTGLDLDDLVATAAWHHPYLLDPATVRGQVDAARVLGLVPADGPVGLTAAGRAVLAGPAALADALPPGRRELVVQADLSVITPPDADADLCAELARIADCESDAGARVWRLSEQRLSAALDAGADAEDVAAFLRGHATAELPQNVTYLLADVARRHGRVRAGAALSYLRSDDPALLAAAVAVKPAKLRLLAPTVAVSELPHDKVVAALRGRGVTVTAEDAAGAAVVDAPARAPSRGGLAELRDPTDAVELAAALLAGPHGRASAQRPAPPLPGLVEEA